MGSGPRSTVHGEPRWIWLQRGPASQSKMLGQTLCELEEEGHQGLEARTGLHLSFQELRPMS